MKGYQKIALVLLGYVTALTVAVSIDNLLHPIRPVENSGMEAGGFVLHFLLLFGVLAMIPTALTIRFLSPPSTGAWDAGVKVSRLVAATGVVALIAFVPILWWERNPAMSQHVCVGLAMPVVGVRVVESLAFGAVDLVALLFAPKAEHQVKFFQTGVIEGAVFAGGVALFLHWPRYQSPGP